MKFLILFFTILLSVSLSKADSTPVKKKTFSKKDIRKLAPDYINNNVKIKDPIIVDVDDDGDFDILNFTFSGNVEFYKNTGSLEEPFFILEDKNYENYDLSTFFPKSLMVPVFFADKDGDNDVDIFAIVKNGYDSKTFQQRYEPMYAENTMDLDHYTLITIILVLIIIALLLVIL